MESIIKTIVDMDKRARKRTMEEQEFFDKADSEYDAKLKAALDEIEKKAQAVSDTLDEQSKANREKWAQELADRAVNAD